MASASYAARKAAGPKERCAYCGGDRNLSVDHIIARARGGTDDPENVQVVCRTCNSMKGTRTPDDFAAHLAKRHGGIHDGKFSERRAKLSQDKFVDKLVFGVS